MGKFENFKQKVKENKGKIIATSVTVAGVVGVIVWQGDKIKNLQAIVTEQQGDIDLLKDVMGGTVLASLKETLTRKLRYHETRLANGLADGVMSQVDEMKRREEIEFISAQLAKVLEAEKHFENRVLRY